MSQEEKDMAATAVESEGRDYLDGFLSNETDSASAPSKTGGQNMALRDSIIASIREIFDPEIPVNIYDLGLIYDVEANDDGDVVVTMTLTTPHCPVAESMPADVEVRVRDVEGVATARVNLVWDPPWDPSRMTEEAQLELGFI